MSTLEIERNEELVIEKNIPYTPRSKYDADKVKCINALRKMSIEDSFSIKLNNKNFPSMIRQWIASVNKQDNTTYDIAVRQVNADNHEVWRVWRTR